MDRKEALEFLELPEFATPDEIKAKLETKLAYFENLSEKAPSPFVRKLHARNVARVKEIMTLSKSWPAARPAVYTEPVAMPERIEEAAPVGEAAQAEATPAAPPPAAPQTQVAEPTRTVEPTRTPSPRTTPPPPGPDEPLAWLVRHTENQSPLTFPVLAGKNYLGRKEKTGATPFIKVEEDPYISKIHAVIIAEPGNPASFFLADDPATNGDRASTNGTYLNGNEDRITKKTRINNNDTIQVGITKLILRYNDTTLDRIVGEIAGKDYMHTVVIDAL